MQFLGKELEYWAVLIGMALYTATRDAERESIVRRVTKMIASGALAVGFGPTLAEWTFDSELVATAVIMGFGIFILDLLSALITDREFIKELVRRKIGGPGE